MSIILAGTGHRPEDCESEMTVRSKISEALKDLCPQTVITGLAAGFDLWLGREALDLGIEVIAARPWKTHGPRIADRELYSRVLAGASRVVDVVDAESYPGPWVYHKRNEWMVDNATHLLAYWSGKTHGGTYNCVKYAMKQQIPMRNIYGRDL
jgi:uncharacterized phage-like protein YoqJ